MRKTDTVKCVDRLDFHYKGPCPLLKCGWAAVCVCVGGGLAAQCLANFTSSAVFWLQGRICSSVEMLQCHLRDSNGQNYVRFGRVRLPTLPPTHAAFCKSSLQVGISNCNVVGHAHYLLQGSGIRGHAMPTQSCGATKDFPLTHASASL